MRSAHGKAEIRLEQDLFQFVQRFLVKLALGQNAGEVFAERIGRARHAGLEPREPPLLFLRRLHRRSPQRLRKQGGAVIAGDHAIG